MLLLFWSKHHLKLADRIFTDPFSEFWKGGGFCVTPDQHHEVMKVPSYYAGLFPRYSAFSPRSIGCLSLWASGSDMTVDPL